MGMTIYKLVITFMGIIAVLYGILVLQAGSGTGFWLVWEAIGMFCFLWAFLLHKNFFSMHKGLGTIFHTFVIIGVISLAVLGGLIAGQFSSKGTPDLEYIIVLGAQVRDDGPSVVLKYRLDAAIEYLNENPDTMCIVSGGQGANEPVSEAEGMAKYLREHGIEENRILLEDKASNTVQNIQNSKELMKEPYNGVGIVTNNFHLFRSVQIAKAQGLENVYGIAADSTPLYLPNNVLRECMGILKDWLMGNI